MVGHKVGRQCPVISRSSQESQGQRIGDQLAQRRPGAPRGSFGRLPFAGARLRRGAWLVRLALFAARVGAGNIGALSLAARGAGSSTTMTIGGTRVARSFRMQGWTRAQPRYIRVDAARRLWLDAEVARNGPCVYLGPLPADVRMSDRTGVLNVADRAMAARAEGARTAGSPGSPCPSCGNRHAPLQKPPLSET